MISQITNKIFRIERIVLKAIEVHLAAVCLAVMFSVFILQVGFRYVLRNPLAWTHEIAIFAFIWTILFGSLQARNDNSHVAFALLYEKMPPWLQKTCRIVSNAFIGTSLLILFFASIEYIGFLSTRKSIALGIPFSYAFAPLLLFMLIIVYHCIKDLYKDIFPSKTNISISKNSKHAGDSHQNGPIKSNKKRGGQL